MKTDNVVHMHHVILVICKKWGYDAHWEFKELENTIPDEVTQAQKDKSWCSCRAQETRKGH